MTRRAERLFEIVQILRQARKPIPARSIAAELETSVRSVYRDIAALMAQRVPITGEPGIGYVLEGGFDMPPLMLTADEVDALVLGAHWVATRGEPELARAAQALLAKIEAVVPAHLQPHVLAPSTSLAPVPVPVREAVSAGVFRSAIRSGRKMTLHYSDEQGQPTQRIIWPVLLGYREAGRILAAWCELRGAFRYFRTDRISEAEILPERIPEQRAKLLVRWRAAMDAEREAYVKAGKASSG